MSVCGPRRMVRQKLDDEEFSEIDSSDSCEEDPEATEETPLVMSLFLDSRDADEAPHDDLYQRLDRLPMQLPCGITWSEEVAEAARSFGKEELIPLGMMCGPAVRLARYNLCVQFAFLILFMFIDTQLGGCTFAQSRVPPGWWFGLLAPMLMVSLCFEFHALQYALPPMLQVLNSYTLEPGCRLRASPWLFVKSLQTLLHITNMASICNFTVVVLNDSMCAENDRHNNINLNQVWREVIQQSLFFKYVNVLSLRTIAALFCLLSLAPYVVAFVLTWPIRGCPPACPPEGHVKEKGYTVTYDVLKRKDDRLQNMTGQYDTLFRSNMNHGAAIIILAEATGMAALQATGGLKYAQKKYDMQKEASLSTPLSTRLNHALTQGDRCLVRVFWAGTMRNVLQLHLQISFYACQRMLQKVRNAEEGAEVMWARLMPILVNILAFLLIYTDFLSVANFARRVLQDAAEEVADEDTRCLRRLRCNFSLLLSLGAVCTGGILYALVKLVASFVCASGVTNINGCVQMGSLLASAMNQSTTMLASRL